MTKLPMNIGSDCVRRIFRECLLGWILLGAWLTGIRAADNPELQPPIETIGEILKHGHEPGYENRPVLVTGVITYAETNWRLTFIQDDTGGIYFFGDTQILADAGAAPGRRMTLRGKIGKGRIRPIILGTGPNQLVTEVHAGEMVALPKPLKVPGNNLADPLFNSQWVEVEGKVSGVRLVDDRAALDLLVDGKPLEVTLPRYTRSDLLPRHLIGLDVVTHGVMGASWDAHDRFDKPQVMVPSVGYITVQPSALEALFSSTTRTVGELSGELSEGRRTRLSGIVTAQIPGLGFFLRDTTGGLWIETPQRLNLLAGQAAEAVGLEVRMSGRPGLRDAYVRSSLAKVGLTPVALGKPAGDPVVPKHGDWVSVRGTVVEVLRGTSETILRLQDGGTAYSARVLLEPVDMKALDGWLPGSQLELRGTVVDGDWPIGGGIRLPGTWRLMVDSAADVRFLRPPAWWTHERLLAVVVTLGAGMLGAGICVLLLRHRVRVQAETIAEQKSRVALSEERGRISRELHDSLEQYLTGLAIQLEAVSAKLGASSQDIKRLVDTAQQMVRHGHADTRAAIWELRSRALESGGLIQALEELLPLAAAGSAIDIQIECSTPNLCLPAHVEHHLLRIAQETVTNSIKHAKASWIHVQVDRGSSSVRMTVEDDGVGFDVRKMTQPDQTGFGLVGMRERAAKLGGKLSILSAPTQGTTIEVVVPIPGGSASESGGIEVASGRQLEVAE